MGYGRMGQVELPVGVERALAALRQAAEAHPTASVKRWGDDSLDVAGRARVRFTVRGTTDGRTEVEHGWWGLRGPGSDDAHAAFVAELLQRTRDAVARGLTRELAEASSGYVGTLDGQAVAVLFAPTSLTLTYGDTSVRLDVRELREVQAVAGAAGGTVLKVVTGAEEDLVHLEGTTPSLVTVELARLRSALGPRPPVEAVEPRRDDTGKLTPVALVREMASIAQLHHDGVLDDDEFALAKADLLGTD